MTASELRAKLPPITRNAWSPLLVTERVVIDLEWERDHPENLLCIGVGNKRWVSQFWWQELDEARRKHLRQQIEGVVRSRQVVYHNGIADIGVLLLHGFDVPAEAHLKLDDTMQAHACLDSEEAHDLGYVLMENREAIGGLAGEWKHLQHEDPEAYNAGDLVQTDYLWDWIERRFALDPAAENIYRTQNLPLMPIVIESERVGLRVNQSKVAPLRDRCTERIEQAVKLAQAYAGYPLNIGSPHQLKDYLYGVEGMEVQYGKAAPGEDAPATTDADAISVLRAKYLDFDGEWEEKNDVTLDYLMERIERGAHPVLEARVLYAENRQTLGHYVAPCTGRDRIYPRIKIHAQASGRHSITDPPMQQLRGELTELVCPDPGTAWIGFDLDQGELRVDAVLTNDEPSIEAFAKGYDIHTMNACDLFGMAYPPDLRDPHKAVGRTHAWRETYQWGGKEDLRRTFAKRFVYRLDYGGQAQNAGDIPGAKTLALTPDKLVLASEAYLDAHPAKRKWREKTEADALRFRVSYTFMGRPRRLTSPYKGALIRAAYNHPHQGAISDVNNHLILRIKAALPYAVYKYGAHDSQWWAVPTDKVFEAYTTMREILAQPWDCYGRELVIPSTFKEVRHAA